MNLSLTLFISVSYTHLDVYKRQIINSGTLTNFLVEHRQSAIHKVLPKNLAEV